MSLCRTCYRWILQSEPHQCTVKAPEREIRDKFTAIVANLNLGWTANGL